jgi:hypothetical protein
VLGTSKERQQARPPTDAADLADLLLEDWQGREVRLGDTWAERPSVLVFLRHYG